MPKSFEHVVRNVDKGVRHVGCRENYMPFDHLLFFRDAGVDGIRFAFVIIGGHIDQDRIYGWYPIGGDRTLLAPSLRAYVEELLSGQLSV